MLCGPGSRWGRFAPNWRTLDGCSGGCSYRNPVQRGAAACGWQSAVRGGVFKGYAPQCIVVRHRARAAGTVLKSADPKGLWGFKSPSRYNNAFRMCCLQIRMWSFRHGAFSLRTAGVPVVSVGDFCPFFFKRDSTSKETRPLHGVNSVLRKQFRDGVVQPILFIVAQESNSPSALVPLPDQPRRIGSGLPDLSYQFDC